MNNENRKNSLYNKIKVIVTMVFILCIVLLNFLSQQKYEISMEMIVCILILTILTLAETFDSLSIPKVLSLKKDVEKVQMENEKLRNINLQLIKQITTINNSQNVYFTPTFSTVGSTDIESVSKNLETDIQEENMEKTISVNKEKELNKYRNNLEVYMLKKVLDKTVNSDDSIQYNVKLANTTFSGDDIMKDVVRFDALKSDGKENVFYEVKILPHIGDFSYQIYYMLRTISLYMEFCKIPCKLALVIPKFDEKLNKIFPYNENLNSFKEKIYKRFESSFKYNMLEIIEVDIIKTELDKYILENENKSK